MAGPAVWQQLLADAQAGTDRHRSLQLRLRVQVAARDDHRLQRRRRGLLDAGQHRGRRPRPPPTGTFPVYVRYQVTTMTGTNPDGSKYSDPGIPWVSYFNGGDALHGFVRGSYGFPQSDGCVEMPPANAAVVFPLTPIGTLVTVA